jgi:gentisate 1,2-dioxygenase
MWRARAMLDGRAGARKLTEGALLMPASPGLAAARSNDLADYAERLRKAGLAPLWESMAALSPFEPEAKAAPHVWRCEATRALLMQAGALIGAAAAERRVAVLANPALPGLTQATDTLYAGLQLLLPGETAPEHRHSQSALRFVMEGTGAVTTVDGERAEMAPGDLILTPAGAWHEHRHEAGGEPVIWLDGLDVPLVGFLRAGFREDGGGRGGGGPARQVRFSFDVARATLARMARVGPPDPHLGHVHDYALGARGGWALPTLGARLTLLPAGFETRPYRSTASEVVMLVQGEAEVELGGRVFALAPGDVLAAPGWTWRKLRASREAVIFSFDDRPVHAALGLYRQKRG